MSSKTFTLRDCFSVVFVLIFSAGCQAGSGAADIPDTREATDSEWAVAMQRCMAASGWEMTILPDGGIESAPVPTGQEEEFQSEFDRCNSESGIRAPDMTRGRAEKYYNELVAVGECLGELGYEFSPVPSEESSVESLMTESDPLWDPYDELLIREDFDEASYLEAQEHCPRPEFGT